jgi:hypothetical protein
MQGLASNGSGGPPIGKHATLPNASALANVDASSTPTPHCTFFPHHTISLSITMAQAAFFYDVAFAFQHFDDTGRAFGVNKYSYHTLAILLDVTLFERDLQLYYEGLVLANRYGDAFDRNLVTERDEQDRRN